MYRLARWLGWSVVVSVTPFLGLLLLRFLDVQHWPGLDRVFGSGQLLLTCVALIAGGVRELSGMPVDERTRLRDFLLLASLIFAVLLAMAYGYIANELITAQTRSPQDEHLVTSVSMLFFVISLVTAGAAIAVSAPMRVGTDA